MILVFLINLIPNLRVFSKKGIIKLIKMTDILYFYQYKMSILKNYTNKTKEIK